MTISRFFSRNKIIDLTFVKDASFSLLSSSNARDPSMTGGLFSFPPKSPRLSLKIRTSDAYRPRRPDWSDPMIDQNDNIPPPCLLILLSFTGPSQQSNLSSEKIENKPNKDLPSLFVLATHSTTTTTARWLSFLQRASKYTKNRQLHR